MLLVKTSTEVKNDEDGEKASIECELEVTGDFNRSWFSTVSRMETRLKRLIKVYY